MRNPQRTQSRPARAAHVPRPNAPGHAIVGRGHAPHGAQTAVPIATARRPAHNVIGFSPRRTSPCRSNAHPRRRCRSAVSQPSPVRAVICRASSAWARAASAFPASKWESESVASICDVFRTLPACRNVSRLSSMRPMPSAYWPSVCRNPAQHVVRTAPRNREDPAPRPVRPKTRLYRVVPRCRALSRTGCSSQAAYRQVRWDVAPAVPAQAVEKTFSRDSRSRPSTASSRIKCEQAIWAPHTPLAVASSADNRCCLFQKWIC